MLRTKYHDKQGPIARALDFLLSNYRNDEGAAVTVEKVAAGVSQKALSATYIYALRSGDRKNPTVSTLELLAEYFGVEVGFFFVNDPAAAYKDFSARSSRRTERPGPENSDQAQPLPTPTQPSESAPILSERIQGLFNKRRRPDGREWSMRQVSAAAADNEIALSVTYLHDLRRGIKDNPNKHQLEFIAKFFGVHPTYFFCDRVPGEKGI